MEEVSEEEEEKVYQKKSVPSSAVHFVKELSSVGFQK